MAVQFKYQFELTHRYTGKVHRFLSDPEYFDSVDDAEQARKDVVKRAFEIMNKEGGGCLRVSNTVVNLDGFSAITVNLWECA